MSRKKKHEDRDREGPKRHVSTWCQVYRPSWGDTFWIHKANLAGYDPATYVIQKEEARVHWA